MLGMRCALLVESATIGGGGGASYGPELVTNGTFDSDTAGWTVVGGTLSSVAGKLRVTSGGSDNGATQDVFGLEIGATYRLRATMIPHEGNRARFIYYNGGYSYFYYETTGGSIDLEFVAGGAGINIGVQAASSTAWASSGEYAEFDNISLQKVL